MRNCPVERLPRKGHAGKLPIFCSKQVISFFSTIEKRESSERFDITSRIPSTCLDVSIRGSLLEFMAYRGALTDYGTKSNPSKCAASASFQLECQFGTLCLFPMHTSICLEVIVTQDKGIHSSIFATQHLSLIDILRAPTGS